MLYSVTLNKKALHRLSCFISLQDNEVPCIIDTGCTNTLIPMSFAKEHGKRLNKTSTVLVGGRSYKVTAYSFDNVYLGGFHIPKMLAFCADYEDSLKSSVLLGLNVLNNLEFTITRNKGMMSFNENVWDLLADKKYPFTVFFEHPDMKPVYPSLLVEEI